MDDHPVPDPDAIVLLPVFGAVAMAITPSRRPDLVRLVGLGTAVITGALTIWLLGYFDTGDAGFQFVTIH